MLIIRFKHWGTGAKLTHQLRPCFHSNCLCKDPGEQRMGYVIGRTDWAFGVFSWLIRVENESIITCTERVTMYCSFVSIHHRISGHLVKKGAVCVRSFQISILQCHLFFWKKRKKPTTKLKWQKKNTPKPKHIKARRIK